MSIKAEGDRPMELEEIVELADAVAKDGGVASGVGAMSYGAQLLVEAESSDAAVEAAIPIFQAAAVTAGLPPWPVTKAEVVGEDEDYYE